MIRASDVGPEAARVIKIALGEQPAKGFSWDDYEGVQVDSHNDASGEDDEGGWGVVKSKSRSSTFPTYPVYHSQPTLCTRSFWMYDANVVLRIELSTTGRQASSGGGGGGMSSSGEMSKKQRQNAAKREAQKQAKLDAEKERLEVLARHKREAERAKMAEQAKARK